MGVTAQAASLVPLGQAVGIQMTTAGVLVADLAEVDTPDGTCTPAKDAGLRPGDVICRMDGREIVSSADFLAALDAAGVQIDKFNFADFIDETVEPLEIADAGHAHNIEIHVPDNIEMEGDQDRLRQLFTNIIANALKHSADNTAVLIEAHENKDFGTIVTNVVNFGSQIPQEARSDIFRRFVKGKTQSS